MDHPSEIHLIRENELITRLKLSIRVRICNYAGMRKLEYERCDQLLYLFVNKPKRRKAPL